jgi:hypothetical protein
LEGFWSELFGQQACMGRKAAENHHIWRAEITLNLFFLGLKPSGPGESQKK